MDSWTLLNPKRRITYRGLLHYGAPAYELVRRRFHRPVMLVGGGFFGRVSLVGIEALRGMSDFGIVPVVGFSPVLMGLTVPRKLGLSVRGMEPLVAFGVRGIGRDCCP